MGVALREHLRGILPGPLYECLTDTAGWRVEVADQSLAWYRSGEVSSDGERQCWSLAHPSGLHADVSLTLDPRATTATLQVSLSNPTDRPSPPISAIKPLSLAWRGIPIETIQIRSLGGGLTRAHYPSAAYRENIVALRPGLGEKFRIASGCDGRSSNQDLPFLQATVTGAVNVGLVVGLEWSGEWWQEVGPAWTELTETSAVTWEAGIPVRNIIVQPGETLALPTVHLIAFQGDHDTGGNACRRYIYDHICPTLDGERLLPPLSYDHWFGIGCDIDEHVLRRQVHHAVEVGVEYFVVDAGWFPGCGTGHDFSPGTGNWERVDRTKFPDGLEPFADYVRAHGLKFGLWFEPERAHRGSDLVHNHPAWFFDIGSPHLHLNLALPEVQDYVIHLMSAWIERLGLEWTRWDYNIGPKAYWERADPTGKIQFTYMAGLYRVLDTLMDAHPRWFVECCASGGRRIDLGTLRRAHTVWFSDHTHDALVCRFMQAGANRFLSGHLLNSAIPVLNQGGESAIPDASIISRMCGAFALNGDIARWSPPVVARVAELVAIYRGFRHLLVGDFYPLTPQPARPGEHEVVQFVGRDGEDSVLLGFAGAVPSGNVIVRPRGLDVHARYRVNDPLGGHDVVESGRALQEQGVILPLDTGAAIRHLRCVRRSVGSYP